MKHLYESLISPTMDGHIHLFDHRGPLVWKMPKQIKTVVGFMDIVFSHLDLYKTSRQVEEYYTNYIMGDKGKCEEILLATGTTAEQAINVYKKFPRVIKGFGEFKCYDEYINGETGETIKLPFGNLDWIYPVFNFDITLKLPIYIHYDIRGQKRYNDLDELLSQYPDIPVVLCHCGMSDRNKDNNESYIKVLDLMSKHPNLYVDISYTAMNFFLENPQKIFMLPPQRVILGSDINPVLRKSKGPIGVENEYTKFNKISGFVPGNDKTICGLFNI